MTEELFVGQEAELARLDQLLAKAVAGHGQVGLVAGEPGSGKSALLRAFVRRAQKGHTNLIVAVGDCNAQVGPGEAYLPFREILQLLTGDLEDKLAQGVITAENAGRIKRLLARSGLVLMDVAPDLLELLPFAGRAAGKLLSPVGGAVVKQTGLEEKLEEIAQRRPDVMDLAQTSVDQEHIFEQYTTFLRKLAQEQPLLIILDDLQWADASSLGLLFHLARRITSSSILILGAYRPDEVAYGRDGQRHPFEKVEAELKRIYGDITLELQRQNDSDGQQLVHLIVDSLPNRLDYGFRQELCRHTGCNPLFVLETLSYLQERGDLVKDEDGALVAAPSLDWRSLPARVEGVIQERIDRLDKEPRETLVFASVEGEEFLAEVVARLRQVNERDLVRQLSAELAKRHRLVTAVGLERVGGTRLSLYRFQHQLLQQYLYGTLDEVELAYLHEDVGNILEALYAEHLDDIAPQLAWHFSRAGLDDKAVAYLRRAGELAAARYAHAEAAQFFTRALDMTQRDDTTTRYELLLGRASVHNWQGNRTAEAEDLLALQALADEMGDSGVSFEVALRRANHARLTGDYAAATTFAERAISEAEEAGDTNAQARACAMLGWVLYQKSEYRESQEWLELGLELARDSDDRHFTARSLYNLGNICYTQGQLDEARQRYEQSLATCREYGDVQGQVYCWIQFGAVAKRELDYAEASEAYQRGLELCRPLGWSRGEQLILNHLGNMYLDLGDNELAENYHREALQLARQNDSPEFEAGSLDTLGLIAARTGEVGAGVDLFRQALVIQRALGDASGQAFTLTHLGYALANQGNLEEADQIFQEARSLRERIYTGRGLIMDDLAGLARVSLAAGQGDQARSYVQDILAWMDDHGTAGVEYPALVLLVCYQVLGAARATPEDRERARSVLERGHDLVMETAERIQDPALRTSFLENIAFNRELLAAWEDLKT